MRQQVIRIKHLLAVMIVGSDLESMREAQSFDHVGQVRKQEAECQEVGAWASMRGRLATRGSTSVMNLQAFPGDFY